MGSDRDMFAEMLGMRRPAPAPESRTEPGAVDFSSADLQEEMEEAMASELEPLILEKEALALEKAGLEEKLAALESDFAALQERLAVIVADNSELEEKLARMGRSLSAARRAAFENRACGKPKTGGAK